MSLLRRKGYRGTEIGAVELPLRMSDKAKKAACVAFALLVTIGVFEYISYVRNRQMAAFHRIAVQMETSTYR